jgi:hypothetical protein
MRRRAWMRLVGGGFVATAIGSLVATGSSSYPDKVLKLWGGPSRTLDLRRWALSLAMLAPSPHNQQPWIADLRDANAITLFVDRSRLLPMTDPLFRQIMIAQGAFIETLTIALRQRGARPTVELFPQGEFRQHILDDRPLALLRWSPTADTPANDPLFQQILHRRTSKIAYDITRPVTTETLASLNACLVDPEVHYGATVNPALIDVLRTLCLESARVEVSTPRTVMESLRLTRIGPIEIASHPDGISVNEPIPRIIEAIGAVDRSNPPSVDSAVFRQTMSRFETYSSTAMGFVWLSTLTEQNAARGELRRAEVAAGRAYMRLQLKATELGLQMHPMSQALQEFEEMKPYYDRLHLLLLGRPSTEETVQMLCRIGYGKDSQHAPRRDLSTIIRA